LATKFAEKLAAYIFWTTAMRTLNAFKICIIQRVRKVAVHLKKEFLNERTIVSKKRITQLHALPVSHFNRCLTAEYSETAAHFNGSFDTDNQLYVP
jgi:hypothetical protein